MVAVFRSRRPFAALAALLLAAAIVLPVTAAQADPIDDKRAQAQAIASKIEALNGKIEQYAEAANGAQVELDRINGKIADAQAQVDAAVAKVDQHRGELKGYAIDAYIKGDAAAQAEAILENSGLGDYGQRKGYLSAASDNRQGLIDQLRTTQEDLNDQIAVLNGARADAEAKTAELNRQKASAEAAVAEQRRLKQQTDAELNRLLQEEQARRQREAEAAAAARQQQAQARAAAPKSSVGVTAGPGPAPSGGAARAVSVALAQVGKPYVWGAAGPNSFDCSGLTMYAWAAAGVSLPHYTVSQYNATTHVSVGALQPGDLVFYNGFGHMGMYIGGGQIVAAPHTGDVVKVQSLYGPGSPIAASRP